MSSPHDQAHQFAALFAGREDAFGTGRGGVIHEPVRADLYAMHLTGEDPYEGIGIFPMLDSNEVCFAAIDLDEPNFELARTMQKLIPGQSWIERSRSGNAHVWVFFDYPTEAWAARAILRNATEAVGRADVEIFPKQDGLREGGVGNYINLPYHGDTRPIVALHQPGGLQPSLGDGDFPLTDFLRLASAGRQDPETWIRRARALGAKPPEEREATSEWGTAPVLHMCAEKIIRERETNPVTPGHRHQVLFHLAVQCLNYRDFDEEEAWEWVYEVNKAAPRPLGLSELDRLFKNARDGQFTFTGCDDPVMQPYVHPDCPIANG